MPQPSRRPDPGRRSSGSEMGSSSTFHALRLVQILSAMPAQSQLPFVPAHDAASVPPSPVPPPPRAAT